MERRYWRVAEVAEALALSKAKVAMMISKGELPAEHFGRAVRVEASALDEFIKRRHSESRTSSAGPIDTLPNRATR